MKHRRILIVEDDDADAALIGHALQKTAERFRLIRAKSLEDARKNILRSPLDLMLVDLDLPDSKGIDTLHKLVWIAPGMPTIVVTGQLNPEHELVTIDAGAVSLVSKSDLDDLVSNVRYALSRHRFEAGVANRILRSTVGQFSLEREQLDHGERHADGGFALSVPVDGLTLPELIASSAPPAEMSPRDRHKSLQRFARAFIKARFRPIDILSALSELENSPNASHHTHIGGFGLELMTHLAEALWRQHKQNFTSSAQRDWESP